MGIKNFAFINKIKKLRDERRIKQSEIAAYLGISPQSYSAYENGREPDYEKLVLLSTFYDVSADYLLGLSDIPKVQTDKELAAENQYLREHLQEIQRIITETRGI